MGVLANHPIWDTIIIFWVFSAAVNALPEPGETSSAFYNWVYVFLTVLLGHVSDAINRKHSSATEAAKPKGPSTYGGQS